METLNNALNTFKSLQQRIKLAKSAVKNIKEDNVFFELSYIVIKLHPLINIIQHCVSIVQYIIKHLPKCRTHNYVTKNLSFVRVENVAKITQKK